MRSPVDTRFLSASILLENAGFNLMPGWLEVFPNRKPFLPDDGSFSLFNGHRLPLQQGSYLLNDELQPVASTHLDFVRQWRLAAARNDISTEVLEQTVKQARRKAYRISGKKVARALPGFRDFCGHQRDLVKKAKA